MSFVGPRVLSAISVVPELLLISPYLPRHHLPFVLSKVIEPKFLKNANMPTDPATTNSPPTMNTGQSISMAVSIISAVYSVVKPAGFLCQRILWNLDFIAPS